MLSAEKNERLTRVGPGTPMGELLRRYWWPVATHDMATRVPVERRLLGEDLVLFRDGSGTVGLLAEASPHRRAALWLGCTEDEGLRCGMIAIELDLTAPEAAFAVARRELELDAEAA
jgi:5,5'-dehydrodivanillate O-demethylase